MSLHYIYSDAPASTIDITDRCRVPGTTGPLLSVKEQAEEGAVPISSLVIDDPEGDLFITGHRRLYIYEDTAPVDNQVIFNGFTANERVARGTNRIGTGRQWTVDLSDPDVLINRRIMNGADANRPAETDLARMLALMGMTELNTVDDDTYINLAAPTTAMNANDYRGKNVGQYIDDCRQASGKNAYILYNEALGQYALWYDFASSSEYDSGCFLTTDELGEVDGTTTFAISVERTYLNRDPSRVASGIWLDYDGGHVYVEDADIIAAFAAIDWAAPSLEVKDSTKATARANRYLNDAKTEHEIIHTVVTKVPRASVNAILKGQLVQFKAEWMDAYVTYRTCRVLCRTVVEMTEDPTGSFEIEMDLDPQQPACPEATESQTFAVLNPTSGNDNAPMNAVGSVAYCCPGRPCPQVPSPNFVGTAWRFHVWGAGGGVDYAGDCVSNHLRILVVGDGTLTIPTVVGDGTTHLEAKLQHLVGGAPVTDETQLGEAGDTFTFTIDTEEMAHCINWVDISEVHPNPDPCGGRAFGYGGGATWVLA